MIAAITRRTFQKGLVTGTFLAGIVFNTNTANAQFTPGNLVVLQIGDGATTLTNTGNPLIFREFNTGGTQTFSVNIPTSGASAMLLRGNATSEGYISRSADGNYVVFGGYVQGLPNATTLNSSNGTAINRGVGLIDAGGGYSIGASSASLLSTYDIRGAAATNSANCWASGSNQGSSYFGSATTAGTVQNTKTNLRASHIFNGQLYISSQVASGTPPDIGVYAVGSGTPNSGPQTVTTVINCGTGAQPGQFYFNAAGTICYVADARTSTLGGIQKWVLSPSNTWTLAYTLPTGTAAAGAFGVVANFNFANPMVYATTTESSANRLIAINDLGAGSTATTLATASTSNTIFRGLAFSPGTSTCVPASIVTTSNNAPVCSAEELVLDVITAGSAPINYAWSGQGNFSSNSVSNPTVTNSSTGVYVVTVSNACGSASAAINVSINTSPTIQVNAATICSGGVATITATGANSYLWDNNTTAPSFTASPATTTGYTVNGIAANGCTATPVTTTITVVSAPSLSVNSPSICLGSSVTLNASGGSTYTWSTNSNSASIVVSPTSTAVYTVSGNAAGCAATVSVTSTVVVNPLPVVSFSTSPSVFCYNFSPSVTLVPSPVGGVFTGSFVSVTTLSVPMVGSYSVTYSYTAPVTGCKNAVGQVILATICGGISEAKKTQMRLYPVPSHNYLNIELESSEATTLVLSDVLGHQIKQVVVHGKLKLDISELSAGLYYLHANNIPPVRFIKE